MDMHTRKCIICETPKPVSEFNEEHIIPEKLGNTRLKTYAVCTRCNGLLGTKIDSELTDNFTSQLFRQKHEICWEKGRIPDSLKSGKTQDNYIIHMDDANLSSGCIKNPKIDIGESGANGAPASFHGDKDICAAITAILKKAKRKAISEDTPEPTEVHIESATINREEVTITCTPKELNREKIRLAYMKIAYEFGYKLWGEPYLEDPIANILRGCLCKCIYENVIATDLGSYTGLLDEPITLPSFTNAGYKYRHFIISTDSKLIFGMNAGDDYFPQCAVQYCSSSEEFRDFFAYEVKYPNGEPFKTFEFAK